jgi:hypothetical protein
VLRNIRSFSVGSEYMDSFYLGIIIIFFALTALLVKLFEHV